MTRRQAKFLVAAAELETARRLLHECPSRKQRLDARAAEMRAERIMRGGRLPRQLRKSLEEAL